jgi:hypothetical protein
MKSSQVSIHLQLWKDMQKQNIISIEVWKLLEHAIVMERKLFNL